MSIDIKLPELGEQITGGDVVAIRVKVGDTVAVDDVLLELETDKAIVEVPSTAAGTVAKVHIAEGATVAVGQTLVTLDATLAAARPVSPVVDAGGDKGASEAPATTPPAAPAKAPAPAASTPTPHAVPPPLATVTAPKPQVPPSDTGAPAAAAPSVRKLARELGVDINRVPAAADGRIHADDIKAFARAQLSGGNGGGPAKDSAPVGATAAPRDDVRRESMSKIRRATARQMALAWNTIPHVTHYDEADITDLERQRKGIAREVDAAGGKLTITAILLKILGEVLAAHPKLTASIDIDANEIVYRNAFHIGVAVDTPRGLLVPVIRDVDRKSLLDLAIELNATSARARTGKVALDELSGATFTVTNLGGIGGTGFSPLINPPEVAILGVSRSRVQPLFIEGEFVPRLVMPFSLSYDHRLIDGADAARFSRDLAEALETPLRLLLRHGA